MSTKTLGAMKYLNEVIALAERFPEKRGEADKAIRWLSEKLTAIKTELEDID